MLVSSNGVRDGQQAEVSGAAASPRRNVTRDTNGAVHAEKIQQKDREVRGKFFVFVKVFQMWGFTHSELAFCMQARFELPNEDALGCRDPAVIMNGTYSYKNRNPGQGFRISPVRTDKPLDKVYIEHFGKHTPKCWITGFPGANPQATGTNLQAKCFDEKKPVFSQKLSSWDPNIFYAGTVSFDDVEIKKKKMNYWFLDDFLTKMKVCGNWENHNYKSREQNYNDYSMTVLKALGLPTTAAENAQHPFARPYLTDFGRWDVKKEACAGKRCMEEKSDTCTRSCTIDIGTQDCRY